MKPRSSIPVAIVILLALATFGVQAQGPDPDPGNKDVQAQAAAANPDVSIAAGIGNPPPAGFAVLYMFTGVANETDSGRDEATLVNCTNYHPTASVDVRVEVFNYTAAAPYAATQAIPGGATRTWSTQSIQAYNDGVILTAVPYVFQGSGRVLVKQHSQVICNAQVLDADADPPVYAVKLPIYDRYGRHAHNLTKIYLPMIRKP
jgi:hypothetical protein